VRKRYETESEHPAIYRKKQRKTANNSVKPGEQHETAPTAPNRTPPQRTPPRKPTPTPRFQPTLRRDS